LNSTKVKGGQLLITGGSGFLGHYLINELQKGWDIGVVDLVKPTKAVKVQKINLRKPFTISKDFEF